MRIELCPETGIGMIVKDDGKKIDLIPDEVTQVREASGDQARRSNRYMALGSTFVASDPCNRNRSPSDKPPMQRQAGHWFTRYSYWV